MDEIVSAQAGIPPEKNRKKWYVAAFFLVILGIGSCFLWWLFHRPAIGVITRATTVEKTDLSSPDHRKRYQGKYFTFTYPYDFARREENESVKWPILERLFLARTDIEGRKIALTLQDNTGNSFEEYGSFRIRRADSLVYHEELIEENGKKVTLFTKDSSVFEVSAFLSRGNQVLSLTVSSPTTQNGLREEVLATLASFEWKAE